MRIYLLRHGETEYNRKGLFYGVTDVPLNQTGVEQSRVIQEKLADLPLDYPVYTSERLRAQQTAELAFPKHERISLACLNEKSFGAWEGLHADEIEGKFPKEWQCWLAEPFRYTPPEADSFFQFQKNIIDGFSQLLVEGKDFVIVSHLGVARVILSFCFPEKEFWDIALDQGNYTCIELGEDGFSWVKWNE